VAKEDFMSKLLFVKGNMLESKCEALVCPVNCEGVMGAGVAKLFRDKKEFGRANELYKQACVSGQFSPGSVLTVLPPDAKEKIVIYVATKMHWTNDSQLQWIEQGIYNLYKAIHYYSIGSVAMPALGCGKGQLPWPAVELMIKAVFEDTYKNVEVYLPHEA
jgi:O-acetyl-ADP-ribose deacetylase (regulator of RNase III)